jgi:F-type H+-transporting ATPase subunit epsilon
MATTHFELVSPSATLYSGEAEMIVCKTVDGEIAFLAEHMPYIGALDPCMVRIVGPGADGSSRAAAAASAAASSGDEIRFAVHGGFVEVKDNQVIMLADMAQTPADIDVSQAERDELDASQRAASGAEPDKAAEQELKWAQARLEVVRG